MRFKLCKNRCSDPQVTFGVANRARRFHGFEGLVPSRSANEFDCYSLPPAGASMIRLAKSPYTFGPQGGSRVADASRRHARTATMHKSVALPVVLLSLFVVACSRQGTPAVGYGDQKAAAVYLEHP